MWLFTPQAGISAASQLDRGLQFGDGVFETMLLKNGQVVSLPRHLQRLQRSIVRLNLPVTDNFEHLFSAALADLQQAAGLQNGIIKLIYTRGCAGRGYLPVNNNAAWYVTLSPLVAPASTPLALAVANTEASVQNQLAGLKHLNRLENVLARMECETLGVDEVVMLNALDEVVEASAHNLFLVIDGELCTPQLIHSGVCGIMRERILDYCLQQGISCAQRLISRTELAHLSSAMLTNSINGPRLVGNFAGRNLQGDSRLELIINAYRSGHIHE